VIAAPAASPTAPRGGPDRGRGGVARSTAAVSALNLVSRATGLLRVVAMSAALGATALGDTYQAANLVSNILFELLAGGLLSAALVPVFVDLLDRDERVAAVRLGGSLLGLALAGLVAVVAVALALAPWLMDLLTLNVSDDAQRSAQTELGTYLLWFFLPQVLLYAVGAVSTALLHADRRFVAAALAPVFNNVVVIASMVAFWALHGDMPSLELTTAEKVVLGGGATLGVLAMTAVPMVASARAGMFLRPRWEPHDPRLRPLVAQGAWAAGHLGLNQIFAMATVIVAGRTTGGVIAYQIAFTFFLLPYALLANPLTTTLYPRLAAGAAADRIDDVRDDLSWGLRTMAFVLVPASFLIAALARPILEVVRIGNLDAAGADLVSIALSGYMAGLVGYGLAFLLTRASYALGDTRSPTLISLVTTVAGVVGLVVATELLDGTARITALGLVHAGVMSASAIGLVAVLRPRVGRLDAMAPLARDVVSGAVAGAGAWWIATLVGVDSRSAALVALIAGSAVGLGLYLVVQLLVGSQELTSLRRTGRVAG
jgi:putative peptidoglycan lipid II flippase